MSFRNKSALISESKSQAKPPKKAYYSKIQIQKALQARPDFSELNQTVAEIKRGFMDFQFRQDLTVIDAKRLEQSNRSKLRAAQRLLEFQREQLAKQEGEFFFDNRNYIYARLEGRKPQEVSF